MKANTAADTHLRIVADQDNDRDALPFQHKATLYLGGKIYLDQMRIALKVSPRGAPWAALLYQLIHHLSSLGNSNNLPARERSVGGWVKLTRKALGRFGLTRHHRLRWLGALAEAGLVEIQHRDPQSARAPSVRLLPRVVPDSAVLESKARRPGPRLVE
jgi:hypothetical protein